MLVDIYYDLLGTGGTTYQVSVVATTTGGEPYTLSPTNTSLTSVGAKAVGSGVSPGEGKHILWDASVGAGPHYTDKMRVKLIADLE
jgi:hypothetical protein